MKASFIEPMLLTRCAKLPEGPGWLYELKLDGYRAIGCKTGGTVHLRSRNDHDFNRSYPAVAVALHSLPDESVIDGEIVAVDSTGRPSFNLLQNPNSSGGAILYYVFDVLVLEGVDITAETLMKRRALLETRVLPRLADPIRYSEELKAPLADLVQSVKVLSLEGLVAKLRNSRYESGQRSDSWRKMRVNRGQDFVIGGYTVAGSSAFDALIFGYYGDKGLIYAARTRSGFTPATRNELTRRFRAIETSECPFVNLPEARSGRWGVGLTADKMKDCRWLKPVLVGRFEFVEWTTDNHLRHTRFIGLRDDLRAEDVKRETD
jgi:bifunctional non-homologous end joining protein LigD